MENDLSPVLDALPGLVWTALPDGNVDHVSRRWCEYTGLDAGQLVGAGWRRAVHPEDLPGLLERWRSILIAGAESAMEARLRRRDGEYHWFTIRVRPLVDGPQKIVKWIGLNIDIEDRGRLGRASESLYRSISDTIPAMVFFMTPTGELESVNQHVLDYVGTTLEDLKGWRTGSLVHPDDLPSVRVAWDRSIATGEPYDVEQRMRRADGVYRWFHVRGMPRRDARGQIVRWYMIESDIDDRRRAESLLLCEKQLLEMAAAGSSMSDILVALCRLVETTSEGCYCSVVLVDPTGTRLEHGAAPSLPATFINSIIGRPVNVDSGPCAMAAHLNEQVIAADLMLETRWAAHAWCPMAMAHGLQACWSTPITSTMGKVVGAFAIYYDKPRTPTREQQDLIAQFSHVASIAIERALSDTALKQSEARKAAILDAALDCIITMDHEGRVIEFNPAAERTFGYPRGEIVGRELADAIIPPALRKKHRQGMARYLRTGETRLIGKRVEMTAVRADGSEFPVELAISRIPLEGPPSFTCYLRDITERRRSEEALQRSGAFLTEAQHLSKTGSFSWCVATGEIIWSEQVYRIFEFDQAIPVTLELIGSRVHPDDISLMKDMIARVSAEAEDFEYEHRLLMPDQSVKYLHLVAHATRNRRGQLEYIGAVQDVTKRRVSEEALEDVRSELARVSRIASLGALTASIAHEVNQPLSGILTNASTCLRMLAADPPNVDGARETARRTIRDGNRASDVIVRLRALFGKRRFSMERVHLNEATQEVIALLLNELKRDRINIEMDFDDDLPTVMGDRVQLQQVILNLVRNASDAMGGIDNRPKRLIVKTERDTDESVRLTVKDEGVGFAPHDLHRIFDAFFTTKEAGMGIGLWVSRSIIENHHGRLWAQPNDTHGASVSFSIPLGLASAENHDLSVNWGPATRDQVMRSL
ncbi:PAS domain S-box-containing protein [Bradyrhizobium shewense]|uniref:histidine kinase n=1 Tax=Bradyrhizobium shewense TaxID=1761772 RepID=A0A1C3USH3_9BRAD|nr:PAS domain S-box protein [Bradyrhizobium shewense]SCB18411.1 PAS domain S-box-containing protein [Bradyrhizobium shewense]